MNQYERDLLKEAAAVIGNELHYDNDDIPYFYYNDTKIVWNPLIQDGDNRRLQCALHLDIQFDEAEQATRVSRDGEVAAVHKWFDGGIDQATRYAVVRAAAAIGERRRSAKSILETRIQKRYDSVPDHIKDDILEAANWAKKTLTECEGSGHTIYVSAGSEEGTVVCSFAKPSWSGDHCGRGMDHGAEAIVMAVCEYLCGG